MKPFIKPELKLKIQFQKPYNIKTNVISFYIYMAILLTDKKKARSWLRAVWVSSRRLSVVDRGFDFSYS